MQAADYSIRVLGSPIRFAEDKLGKRELAVLANEAGIDVADLGNQKTWLSSEQFEGFLEGLRRRLDSDDAFKSACTYRLEDGYGPIVHVLWAASPGALYSLTTKTYGLVARVGTCEIVEGGRTSSHMRITSDRRFSRLVCLVRQAQLAALPTLWGLPPATLKEDGCVAFGDDACNFHFQWFDTRRILPVLVGAGLGAAAYALAPFLHQWSMPAFGAALGFIYEFLRTDRINVAKREEMISALQTVAAEEVEARREIQELHARQNDWTRMLEESEVERGQRVKAAMEKLEKEEHARASQIRGVSHDLKSPLSVVISGACYLREGLEDQDQREVVDEIESAAWRMNNLVVDLMSAASSLRGVKKPVEEIAVPELVEVVRRRLRALVHGRDIRVSAFLTREAPASFTTNLMVLDRILDNIFGNAAKYTDRGSILFEGGRADDYFVMKVSDTGRGIAEADIHRIFHPEGSDPTKRATNSHGVGLSVVIELLWQLGGKLEVMSKPQVGTTFWIHIPIKPRSEADEERSNMISYDEVLAKVLHVRPHGGESGSLGGVKAAAAVQEAR